MDDLNKLGFVTPIKRERNASVSSTSSTESIGKKRKCSEPIKTPIKKIRIGESMIDITLVIVAFEKKKYNPKSIQKNEHNFIGNLIGSDGTSFIQITFWGESVLQEGKLFTVSSLEKCFKFSGLKSIAGNEYNFGSVPYQLQWQNCSQYSQIMVPQEKFAVNNSIKMYYDFLKEKMSLSIENFHPTKLHYLLGGEECDIEVMIISVGTVNTIGPDEKFQSKVCNVNFTSGISKGTITGWNIFAEFTNQVFKGKEGQSVMLKLKKIEMKDGNYKVNMNLNTKFSFIPSVKNTGNIPSSLVELIGMNGFNAVDIQVIPINNPIILDQGQKTSMVMVIDSEYKAQLKYCSDILLAEKEFLIKQCTIEWNEAKVLTLHIHSAEDIQFIKDPILGGKGYEKLDWDYPGDISFDEEDEKKLLNEGIEEGKSVETDMVMDNDGINSEKKD